jgi:hypothetical protein
MPRHARLPAKRGHRRPRLVSILRTRISSLADEWVGSCTVSRSSAFVGVRRRVAMQPPAKYLGEFRHILVTQE